MKAKEASVSVIPYLAFLLTIPTVIECDGKACYYRGFRLEKSKSKLCLLTSVIISLSLLMVYLPYAIHIPSQLLKLIALNQLMLFFLASIALGELPPTPNKPLLKKLFTICYVSIVPLACLAFISSIRLGMDFAYAVIGSIIVGYISGKTTYLFLSKEAYGLVPSENSPKWVSFLLKGICVFVDKPLE